MHHVERVGAAFGGGARAEGDRALVAVPALENLVLFIALAASGDLGTGAIDAALQGGVDCDCERAGRIFGMELCARCEGDFITHYIPRRRRTGNNECFVECLVQSVRTVMFGQPGLPRCVMEGLWRQYDKFGS